MNAPSITEAQAATKVGSVNWFRYVRARVVRQFMALNPDWEIGGLTPLITTVDGEKYVAMGCGARTQTCITDGYNVMYATPERYTIVDSDGTVLVVSWTPRYHEQLYQHVKKLTNDRSEHLDSTIDVWYQKYPGEKKRIEADIAYAGLTPDFTVMPDAHVVCRGDRSSAKENWRLRFKIDMLDIMNPIEHEG